MAWDFNPTVLWILAYFGRYDLSCAVCFGSWGYPQHGAPSGFRWRCDRLGDLLGRRPYCTGLDNLLSRVEYDVRVVHLEL